MFRFTLLILIWLIYFVKYCFVRITTFMVAWATFCQRHFDLHSNYEDIDRIFCDTEWLIKSSTLTFSFNFECVLFICDRQFRTSRLSVCVESNIRGNWICIQISMLMFQWLSHHILWCWWSESTVVFFCREVVVV